METAAISQKTETVVLTKWCIELDEQQARAFLVDAGPLQKQVRAALGAMAQARNPHGINKRGGKAIRLGGADKAQRGADKAQRGADKAKPRPKAPTATEAVCDKCGATFSVRGLTKHRNRCQGGQVGAERAA